MAYGGSTLRSSAIDYIRPHDMELLRRDLEHVLSDMLGRNSELRLGGLHSLGSSSLGNLDQREALDVVRRCVVYSSLLSIRSKGQ